MIIRRERRRTTMRKPALPFATGDRVRLTSAFLRATCQYTGPEPFAVWTVIALSTDGRILTTNEPRGDDGTFTADELTADPSLAYRRILAANVERVRSRKGKE